MQWWERSGAITRREAARAASCSAAGARASAAAAALCDPANPSIVDLRKLWAQASDKHYQQVFTIHIQIIKLLHAWILFIIYFIG